MEVSLAQVFGLQVHLLLFLLLSQGDRYLATGSNRVGPAVEHLRRFVLSFYLYQLARTGKLLQGLLRGKVRWSNIMALDLKNF